MVLSGRMVVLSRGAWWLQMLIDSETLSYYIDELVDHTEGGSRDPQAASLLYTPYYGSADL